MIAARIRIAPGREGRSGQRSKNISLRVAKAARFHLLGMSYRHIAQALGVSRPTVAKALQSLAAEEERGDILGRRKEDWSYPALVDG